MMGREGEQNGERQRWNLTREKILLFFGIAWCVAIFVDTQFFGHPFHFEFLLGALACCGIAIAQWGDRSGKE